MTAEPGDQGAADAVARGYLRSSHADREQVVGVLKAAFIQGRLTKDELDLRVGQALAARTYAELADLTADLPAGLTAARPSQPARARSERRGLRPGVVLAVGTVVYAAVWPVALALPVSGPDHDPHAAVGLVGTSTFFYLIFLVMTGTIMVDSWLSKRSGRQLPPGDQGRSHTVAAARRRRPPPACS